jgi:hypothetical protein
MMSPHLPEQNQLVAYDFDTTCDIMLNVAEGFFSMNSFHAHTH